tara:strand:+ start:524 stop:1588 length:1065 start_codon:yes stop_codon:yes gene_type:complete
VILLKQISFFFVIFLYLNLSWVYPVIALKESNIELESIKNSSNNESFIYADSHQLKEVAPPGSVQKIRGLLDKYDPDLSIEYPAQDEIILKGINESWDLILNLKSWPLAEDPELGIGPHLVVQVDTSEPIKITHADSNRIVIPMDGLNPGSHRVVAYLVYPWGEAVKKPGSNAQLRVHFFKKMEGSQPSIQDTWLTVVSPSNINLQEPVLLDSILWNAPIQGLKEGDDRWRLKISVNDESFYLNQLKAIWIEGLSRYDNTVEFELVNILGEPINPFFNNQLKIFSISSEESPLWIQSNSSEEQLSQLIGEFDQSKQNNSLETELNANINSNLKSEMYDPFKARYELIFPDKAQE